MRSWPVLAVSEAPFKHRGFFFFLKTIQVCFMTRSYRSLYLGHVVRSPPFEKGPLYSATLSSTFYEPRNSSPTMLSTSVCWQDSPLFYFLNQIPRFEFPSSSRNSLSRPVLCRSPDYEPPAPADPFTPHSNTPSSGALKTFRPFVWKQGLLFAYLSCTL